MRLAQFLEGYPNVRVATPRDNDRILQFFESSPMHTTQFEVQYRRRPDFFRLQDYRSDRFLVFIGEHATGGVGGVASLSLRPAWLDGQPTTVGYWADLRVELDRTGSRVWRQFFTDIMSRVTEIEELADCRRWYTVVLDTNLGGLASLRSRADQPRLVPLAPFTMRNLVARLPSGTRFWRRNRWKASAATPCDWPAIVSFFEDENRAIPLGFRGELGRRMSRWDGLSAEDFVYVADDDGIVACMAPWSPILAKQTVISHLPTAFRLVSFVVRQIPSLGIRLPRPGEELRAHYLTHLTFAARLPASERALAFRAMLDLVFDRARRADWHCLSLCDFVAWNLGQVLGGFVQQTVPITLYAIVPPGQEAEIAEIRADTPPGFEMALV